MPQILKNLKSANPNLLYFDLYRLGQFINIAKHQTKKETDI
jgi:hypothetical protein